MATFVALAVSTPSTHAAVLCASPIGGHVKLRTECRRNETRIDAGVLRGAAVDPVPLEDWTPAPAGSGAGSIEGLESVASTSQSAMTPVTPCRLIDTRPATVSALPNDDIGSFADGENRDYTVVNFCGIPEGATAISINLAIVPGAQSGFASVGPTSTMPPVPSFASINFLGSGPAVSNSLVVPIDENGQLTAYAARIADVIIDTNGYFTQSASRTIHIPGTGSPTENGTALKAAATQIVASLDNWTIELGPGVFDLGSAGVGFSPQVTLKGQGSQSSTITCDCDNAVMLNRDESEIRDLRVENTDASATSNAILVTTSADDVMIQNVQVMSDNGRGIHIQTGAGEALIENVLADTEEACIEIAGTTSGVVRNSALFSADGFALFSHAGTTFVRHTELSSGPNVPTVQAGTGGTLSIFGSVLRQSTGHSVATGFGEVHILDSFVEAGDTAIPGTIVCRAISTPTGFLETTCP